MTYTDIPAGTTINVTATLEEAPETYKSIYAVLFTSNTNATFFYYGTKQNFLPIENGLEANTIKMTLPASVTAQMSGKLQLGILLDQTIVPENIGNGSVEVGINITKSLISTVL